MKRIIIITLITVSLVFMALRNRPVTHGPGQVAPEEPFQEKSSVAPFSFKGVTIKPLADFEMTARVLHKESYSSGLEGDLAPWDIAFGWGPMSDETVLDEIDITQSSRFYFWQVSQYPIPRRQIELNSANMHLIPADDNIENLLDDVREGEVLYLNGYLVRIEGNNGWHWQSSLTRQDTGNGACEVIFVTDLSVD